MDSITGKPKSLIGMVHLAALPGTPRGTLSVADIVAAAVAEARLLARHGYDAILVENMHDAPYLKRQVGPEIVAAMTAACLAIREAVALPLGVQILAGANREALAVAHAVGAQFIRAEGFVFAHVADEGLIESDAGELLRYRRAIGATGVLIAADIKKKHSSHAITADVDLAETAHAAEFFGADVLIVTGTATGKETDPADLKACAAGSSLSRMVGSGVDVNNLPKLWALADGFVVGSSIKIGGDWRNAIDESRAKGLADVFAELSRGDRG